MDINLIVVITYMLLVAVGFGLVMLDHPKCSWKSFIGLSLALFFGLPLPEWLSRLF